MTIKQPEPLEMSSQINSINYRVLSTFDAVIVHHSQTDLIEKIKQVHPENIFSLERESLRYRMIDSPVMVLLNLDIANILEKHLIQSELLSQIHGISVLLDYTEPSVRAKKTRLSAIEYLPMSLDWHPSKHSELLKDQFEPSKVANALANNQIIQLNNQKKHFRYLDPQVLLHLLPLNQHHYIVNRYAYPKRIWLSINANWHSLNNIHNYTPNQVSRYQRLSSYCPLSQAELNEISMINLFFTSQGINSLEIVMSSYEIIKKCLRKLKKYKDIYPSMEMREDIQFLKCLYLFLSKEKSLIEAADLVMQNNPNDLIEFYNNSKNIY